MDMSQADSLKSRLRMARICGILGGMVVIIGRKDINTIARFCQAQCFSVLY